MISKVSAIITTFTEGDSHCLTEIAALCQLPVSTVHRLVVELTAWRILDRDDDGRYRAGSPLRLMGPGAGHPNAGIRERVAPIMDDLGRVAGTVVRFGVLEGGRVAYLQKSAPERPVSEFTAAATLPAHATAMGKVLLAFSPREVVDMVISQGLPGYTRRTVTRTDDLRKALRLIRLNRMAVVEGELRSVESAVAAPVFGAGGQVIGAIELQATDVRCDVERARGPLTMAAGALSRELSRSGSWSGASPDRRSALSTSREPVMAAAADRDLGCGPVADGAERTGTDARVAVGRRVG